jgi:hypothetical protein
VAKKSSKQSRSGETIRKARGKKKAAPAKRAAGAGNAKYRFSYCSQPKIAERMFNPGVTDGRVALIRNQDKKWLNGTNLHYFFFKTPKWRGSPDQREVVRNAFKAWKDLGIGLEFSEVDTPDEAEIRIGFQRGDGAWSYLGRDVLNQAESDRTMNFGWNVTHDIDTPIHEIGHTLGFPHEHQNPNAGIVWDEEAVYAELAGPPNNWSRAKTHWNIIRKLPQSDVEGSVWDKDSIMHYPFDRPRAVGQGPGMGQTLLSRTSPQRLQGTEAVQVRPGGDRSRAAAEFLHQTDRNPQIRDRHVRRCGHGHGAVRRSRRGPALPVGR